MILAFGDMNSPLIPPRIISLKELGEDMIVVANADCKRILKSDFHLVNPPCISNQTIRYFLSSLLTLWLIITCKPKVIVVHWASRIWQSLILSLFGKKVIVHTMGGDIDIKQDAKGSKFFFTSLLLRQCKIITVKSEYMKKMLLSNFDHIDTKKIIIISWGVEKNFFMASLEWEKRENSIFCLRALRPFYRIKEIIETFILYKNTTQSCLKLYVSTYNSDNEYENFVRSIVKNSLYTDDIEFIHVDHKDMASLLGKVKGVVSFATADGLPQSFMESLATRTYVIANNLENYNEILIHKKNSFLVEKEENFIQAFSFIEGILTLPAIDNNDFLDYDYQKQHYRNICEKIINNRDF